MNNGYGIQLPAMVTPSSINLGSYYNGMNAQPYHLSNLLEIGMPMPGIPGTLSSTSPSSSPLTNSLPPITMHQQHQQHQHHQIQLQHHHQQQQQQQQHHHQQQQHHQQTQHHHQHQQQQHHQQQQQQQVQQQNHIHHHQHSNQSQQQTPQPSPQHTSNSLPQHNTSLSLPSSDSIQSPIYDLPDHSLLSSSNANTHIQNISINTTITNTLSDLQQQQQQQQLQMVQMQQNLQQQNLQQQQLQDMGSPKIKSKKNKNGKSSKGKVICTPLESSLNSLTKEQLVQLCSQFFQISHPDLVQEFENLMPPPDLHEIMLDLDSLQKKYNKLFPSNEFSYDNASYNRVKSGLASFKKALIEYGEDFKEKSGWATLLQYVILALPYALRMPQWDDEKNNASRVSALNKMDVFGKAAVKGLLQNDLSLEKWERHKASLSPHQLYLKSTIEELDKCIDKRKKKEEKYDKQTKKRKKLDSK